VLGPPLVLDELDCGDFEVVGRRGGVVAEEDGTVAG